MSPSNSRNNKSRSATNGHTARSKEAEAHARTESPPSERSEMATKDILSEAQKKANHIQSEQKRREKIREQYDKLAELTPGMEGNGRSEGRVLEEAVKFAAMLQGERDDLIKDIQARGGVVEERWRHY